MGWSEGKKGLIVGVANDHSIAWGIAKMLASVEHLAEADTTIVAMKGVEPVAELASLPPGWEVLAVSTLDVPSLGARRCAVTLKRSARG